MPRFFQSQQPFRFMKFRYFYFALSAIVLIPGLFSFFRVGLRPAVDFTGGSLMAVRSVTLSEAAPNQAALQKVVGDAVELVSVQSGGQGVTLIRGREMTNQQKDLAVDALKLQYADVVVERFETVGPVLGQELIRKALVAIALVAGAITIYVWHQFRDLKYGVCAVLAMFHDTFVLIGSFSLLGATRGVEVDVLFVTALLTTLSFSIHDTIVVYDRIRETLRRHPRATFLEAVDAAVLQTLSRSINNSMTIIIMLLALALLGGETIRWFVVALLIGAVTGTYSSTFTAAPLLLLWNDIQERRKHTSPKIAK